LRENASGPGSKRIVVFTGHILRTVQRMRLSRQDVSVNCKQRLETKFSAQRIKANGIEDAAIPDFLHKGLTLYWDV
jgi:hypothetical protein